MRSRVTSVCPRPPSRTPSPMARVTIRLDDTFDMDAVIARWSETPDLGAAAVGGRSAGGAQEAARGRVTRIVVRRERHSTSGLAVSGAIVGARTRPAGATHQARGLLKAFRSLALRRRTEGPPLARLWRRFVLQRPHIEGAWRWPIHRSPLKPRATGASVGVNLRWPEPGPCPSLLSSPRPRSPLYH